MFENMTQDEIINRMIEKAKTDVTVIEGSFLYNAFSVAAVALEDAYDKAEEIYQNAFEDTCDREHLIRFARKKGLAPKDGAKNKIKCTFKPFESINIGDVITNGEHSFVVKSKSNSETEGIVLEAEAEDFGEEFNEIETMFEPVEFRQNFESCEVIYNEKCGTDSEDTEDFRQRYFDSLTAVGMFGNKKNYVELIESIEGVGKAVVWDGGTPVFMVLDTNYNKADSKLKEKVREVIKENQSIGHSIGSFEPQSAVINIEASLTVKQNGSLAVLQEQVKAALEKYLRFFNKNFGETRNLYKNRIESEILRLDGVEDFTIVRMEEAGSELTTENLGIYKGAVTSLGEVTFV